MIISASRRTDIPAFYSKWFMNRISAGYCAVPNPFNRKQVGYISLKPEDVDVIVFWTRFPRPMFRYLAELDRLGYCYYFQYTIMNNPRSIDPKTPSLKPAIRTFKALADRIGPERVIWRYDPILFSTETDARFHERSFERIALDLCGYTRRSVISIVDIYSKAKKRLAKLAKKGVEINSPDDRLGGEFHRLMHALVRIAEQNSMEITSCAEEIDLRPYGIRPGKCVDDEYIKNVFGVEVTGKKDPGQRKACGCVVSRDIGMYDTCLFGCTYCYATRSFELARKNHKEHLPDSPSLTGWHDAGPAKSKRGNRKTEKSPAKKALPRPSQRRLF